MENKITSDTLIQAGWHNSWIGGVRRWHHKTLPAHFKTLTEAKALYIAHQQPVPRGRGLTEMEIAAMCGGYNARRRLRG